MNTFERSTVTPIKFPLLDKEHGLFNSTSIRKPISDVFEFCKNEANVSQVLAELPMGLENFLNLTLESSGPVNGDEYEIRWKNKKDSKVQGTLSFILRKASADRGTFLFAIAEFDKLNLESEEPSDLMNIFLKRMKALAETGVLATTKGQPSGREELEDSEEQTLH